MRVKRCSIVRPAMKSSSNASSRSSLDPVGSTLRIRVGSVKAFESMSLIISAPEGAGGTEIFDLTARVGRSHAPRTGPDAIVCGKW